jgi:tetratricopeptide (TPR) repeat protein
MGESPIIKYGGSFIIFWFVLIVVWGIMDLREVNITIALLISIFIKFLISWLLFKKKMGKSKIFEKFGKKQNIKLDKAIKVNPDAWAILFQKGKNLADLGRRDEAEEAFKKAIEINPDAWAVWYQRGKNLADLGRRNEADEAFKKAKKIKQHHPEDLAKEGIALDKLGRERESEGDKGGTMVEKKGDAGVFISYIHDNKEEAYRLYEDLQKSGIKVWIDKDKIKPGDFWPDVIRDAIKKGSFFIACFSKEFNERTRSHMHEELTLAIEELRKRPKHRAWFIPVLFSGEVPNLTISDGVTLRDIQWVDLRKEQDWDEGIHKILSVVSSNKR